MRFELGQVVTLPDGPTGRLIKIERGVEYGDPVLYLSVQNSLGQTVTRWVRETRG